MSSDVDFPIRTESDSGKAWIARVATAIINGQKYDILMYLPKSRVVARENRIVELDDWMEGELLGTGSSRKFRSCWFQKAPP